MGEVKHTPGPWRYAEVWCPRLGSRPTAEGERVDALGNVFYGYSISGSNEGGASILPTLAAVHNFPGQIEANARLIAAAPELLEGAVEADGCFEAALAEGWLDALADGDIDRIRDIWERRISHARPPLVAAIAKVDGR